MAAYDSSQCRVSASPGGVWRSCGLRDVPVWLPTSSAPARYSPHRLHYHLRCCSQPGLNAFHWKPILRPRSITCHVRSHRWTQYVWYAGSVCIITVEFAIISLKVSVTHLKSCGSSPAIWDHTVTCHPTQVNVPCLNPSQIGQYSICLPRRNGRLSWLWCWLYTKMV